MNAGSWSQGIGSNGGTNSIGQGIIEGFPETLDIGWEIEKKQQDRYCIRLFPFRKKQYPDAKKNDTNIKWFSCQPIC